MYHPVRWVSATLFIVLVTGWTAAQEPPKLPDDLGQQEIEQLRAERDRLLQMNQDQGYLLKKAQADLEKLQRERIDLLTRIQVLKAEQVELIRDRDALQQEAKQRTAQLDQLRADLGRVMLEQEALKLRNEKLLAAVEKLQQQIQAQPRPRDIRKDAPPPNVVGQLTSKPKPEAPAKPGVLRGKVLEISETSNLVTVSLGRNDGVNVGQMLEVFRLGSANPRDRNPPLYLGQLKVIRVDPLGAIAQFVPVTGLERRLRVGDDVASELLP